MGKLRVYGLGTYYTTRSVNDGVCPADYHQLRVLVYALKAKMPPSPCYVAHPWHETQAWINSQQAAAVFAAKAFATKYRRQHYHIVPMPSSQVTKATMGTARWGAFRFAQALAAEGFGTVVPALVNKVAVDSGQTRRLAEILDNLEVVQRPGTERPLLLVDDTVTQGATLGAACIALDKRRTPPPALVIGVTSNRRRASAVLPVLRTLEIDDEEDLVWSDLEDELIT